MSTEPNPPDAAPSQLPVFAVALGLPLDADEGAVLAAIDARQLLHRAETLDQVRRGLGLAADAGALDCAAAFCARLPPDWHHAAVLAMQLVAMKERIRGAHVEILCRNAIRAADTPIGP